MPGDTENVTLGAEAIRAAAQDEGREIPLTKDASVPDYKVSLDSHGDMRSPTEEELHTLRRVPEKIHWNIYTIAFIELCERFSYYGTTAVFTNFIQQPLPVGSRTGSNPDPEGKAGVLGRGQRASTSLTTFNQFWQYTMPLFGAYIADSHLGRYHTISWALLIDIIGHVILIMSAIPPVITGNTNGSLAALILGIITMGFGTGGFKPNVNPLIVEQLDLDKMTVMTLPKTGERVIIDPAVTASRVYHYFYMFINIGALVGQIAMVYCAKFVGFWLAFLLPTIMLCICPLVLLYGRKRYRRVPPQGSVLGKSFKLFHLANQGRWHLNPVKTYKHMHDGTFWESVKPSKMDSSIRPAWMDFNDAWVDEVARGFNACAVFLWYPLFWICYNQINNNLISQAATMRLNSIPNDVLTNLNPFALIIMIPLLDTFVYPTLRKFRINFTPIRRITMGYFVAAAAMIWACVIQYYIYSRSECGYYASDKGCATIDISVWAQSGSYILIAFSEILASITSLEYAHSKAPANMRSMVQAVALFMNAISSAIGFALVYLASDPYLIWNYGVVAVLATLGGIAFWLQFRHLDQEEDHLNMLPKGEFGVNNKPEDENENDPAKKSPVADPGALSYPKEEKVETSNA